MGSLHGGIICDVADAAMGVAYASTLGDEESFTTIELKINFLRPFKSGTLIATAHVGKAGRTIGLVECDVTDTEGRLVARALSTCMTLRSPRVPAPTGSSASRTPPSALAGMRARIRRWSGIFA